MLDRAGSLAASDRLRQLSTVMIEPQLTRVLKRIEEMRNKNLMTYGTVAPHVRSIQINLDNAIVLDCQDSSRAGLIEVNTRQIVNRGVKEGSLKALLNKSPDGQWRVSRSITLNEGC